MKSFVIFCRSFWLYKVDANTETGTWNGALAMLGIRVVFIDIFLV